MRKPFTVIINLLLTALMIVMLPGVQLAAEDEPKKPQENVVYNIGDKILLESDSWVVVDDSMPGQKKIEAGTYTLENIEFSPVLPSGGDWDAYVDFKADDGYSYDLEFNFYDNKLVETDMNKRYLPKGIECFSGDGSEGDPFRFKALLEKIPAVQVTLEMVKDMKISQVV